jgi:polygalacturonase
MDVLNSESVCFPLQKNNLQIISIVKKRILTVVLQILAINLVSAQPSFDWMQDVGAHAYPQKTQVYNVADYGAEGDALKFCTESIQKAIDDCSKNGGGIVTFSPGIFLTGSVFIKDNVDFKIPKGTMLIGSQNIDDYQQIDTRIAGIEMKWPSALINIINSKNVAISGDGVINGRGKVFWDKYWTMRKEYDPKGLRWIVDYDCQRPRGILIANCSDVTVKDIVFYQPGFWSLHILYSHHITVDNIIISNNIEGKGPSTDGIDIDSSEKVLVQNSHINCNDDNFCLKAGRDADGLRVNRPCQYVVIRDCIAGHGDGLFTCGSETSGGIKHIVAYNLKGLGTSFGLRFKSTARRGGTIEDIYFYNIEMIGVKNPLILDLNWYPASNSMVLPEGYNPDSIPSHWKTLLLPVDPGKGLPKFKDIHFENVSATHAEKCITASGLENSVIEHFDFKNVRLQGEKAGNISYAENWLFDGFLIDAKNGDLKLTNNKNISPFK